MSYELFISRRYLRAKRKQVFVSIITFISIFGIFLGVAALIIVLAVMNGFEEDLRTKILGIKSHIEVTTDMTGPMKNYSKVSEVIAGEEGVGVGWVVQARVEVHELRKGQVRNALRVAAGIQAVAGVREQGALGVFGQ